MRKTIEFLRRNALILLFGCLIVSQILTWRAIVAIGENVDHYICGNRSLPCHVIVDR
jgi:hypothetical protein